MFHGRVRHIHFVGIGEMEMSGLAEILRALGYRVSGSEMQENSATRRLQMLDIRVDFGHRGENISGADLVICSRSIGTDNPEIVAAGALGITVISRATMLAELMRVRYGVAVAGSRGKTTTTSLIATVLRAAGLDPTVVLGGKMASIRSNARLGAGRFMVAEAKASDGSLDCLTPTVAVVTSIDPERLDHHGSQARQGDPYGKFLARVPFYGLSVLCLDDAQVKDMLPGVPGRRVTYGLSPHADYAAHQVQACGPETTFEVSRRGEPLGTFTARLSGAKNVGSCLAAIAVADEFDVPFDITRLALGTFGGVSCSEGLT